jgi:hypothetical protein
LNKAFLHSEPTLAWLSQFEPSDQPVAQELLESFTLVGRDAFIERLRLLIHQRLDAVPGSVGLYAEREVPKRKGIPHRLFKETDTKVRRAHGVGPIPVQPIKLYDPSVGSEGIVAQLISEICKAFPDRCHDHPGPDKIRKKCIRRFVIVTDFVGSGARVSSYLGAAWRVRSVRSWWSARAAKGMSFEVVSYSATQRGRSNVETHPSRPILSIVTACTSITELANGKRQRLKKLCELYNTKKGRDSDPLGWGGIGALIAFAHGAPNNVPRILYQKSQNWAPLFQERITGGNRELFGQLETDADSIESRLLNMRQTRLAAFPWLRDVRPQSRAMLAVLAAISTPPRTIDVLSARTGITILEVERVISTALANDWITDGWRLTDAGHAELNNARKVVIPASALPEAAESLYCPTSLRAPSGVSS